MGAKIFITACLLVPVAALGAQIARDVRQPGHIRGSTGAWGAWIAAVYLIYGLVIQLVIQ